MKIGASTGAFYPQALTEHAAASLARLGFSVLEIMLQTSGEYDLHYARALARQLDESGARVHSLHAFTGLHPVFSSYQRRRDEGMALFRRAIEAAVVLGARCVVWHGLTRRDQEAGASWDAFQAVLSQLATECASAGVTLTLENVSWCAVRDAESVERVRAWGLPIGFTLDPFQAVEAGADLRSLIRAMSGRIVNVHLSDHAPAARHLPVGEGTMDWLAILGLIRNAGYDGPLILEGVCGDDTGRLVRSRRKVEGLLRQPPGAPE